MRCLVASSLQDLQADTRSTVDTDGRRLRVKGSKPRRMSLGDKATRPHAQGLAPLLRTHHQPAVS
uniref:Uncharacterized protein n=1 Tax=Oryza sativa subsp. japonica TaxID=39947 RepID=Q6YYV3_ORYSJ|nr:hypothetical protein [Oryza sativa Japonica Group]